MEDRLGGNGSVIWMGGDDVMDGDPYNSGTPKYSTAWDIYDALHQMASGEEIGILSEMFGDISWDGQDYYYTDNGYKLKERWEQMTDYNNKMWLVDVAIWQLADDDANEWIPKILYEDDLAKRIGFKKLFVEHVLRGMSNQYKDAIEAYEEALQEFDRGDYYDNCRALEAVLPGEMWDVVRYRYGNLCRAVYNKLKGLRLDTEKQLVAESRAMLIAYDDFMFGLRANQILYEEQGRMYQNKVAQLQAQYEDAKRLLLAMAQEQGVVLQLPGNPLMIESAAGEETCTDDK